MTNGSTPRPKLVHRADRIRDDGSVSALCFPKPRRIDLRRATWTLVDSLVTCERCQRTMVILAEQAAQRAEEVFAEAFGS